MNELFSSIQTILTGAWRPAPPPVPLSAQALAAVTPRLLDTGAGALGWWRVRQTEHAGTQAGHRLHQAYRLHTLQAALREVQLQQVLRCMYAAGINPLLSKGWTVARLYPEPGLRPFGDFDLYVLPEQYTAAKTVLTDPSLGDCPVDLHCGFSGLVDRGFGDLRRRSQVVQLADVPVRMLGHEDQLRHLCLHLLKHGAWRPLWLCDVAAALESRPADFNWDYCLHGARPQADWLACALGLAHQLLGARLEGVPCMSRAQHLPRWLAPSVLRQWAMRYTRNLDDTPMAVRLRQPAGILQALRWRWPNPIEATVSLKGPFNEVPRVFFQLGDCVVRTARLAWSLARFG